MTVLLMLGGCSLDRYPETSMPEDVFWNLNSAENFNMAANYLYSLVPHRFVDCRADDQLRRNYPNDISAGTRKVPATSSDWTDPYRMIFAANKIIGAVPAEDIRLDEIRKYVAEAHFFRAYAYFSLLARYGAIPLVTVAPDDIDDPVLYSARAQREEVVGLIYEDLDMAAADLPLPSYADSETNADFGRVTRTAAWAFKSRVALYEGTHMKYHGRGDGKEHLKSAYEAASLVMASGKHELYKAGPEPYRVLFLYEGENVSEIILPKIYGYQHTQYLTHNYVYQYAVNYTGTRNFLSLYLRSDGLPYVDDVAAEMTYNDFFDDRDPRMSQTFLRRGQKYYTWEAYTPTAAGFGVRKWVRDDGKQDQPSTIDFPLIRYAEVLATYAEAKFEHDGEISDEDLDKSVNLLRDRVGMPHITNAFVEQNGLDMLEEIRRERSVELALEGLRYDDLIRWKTAEELLPVDILGAKYIKGEWGNTSSGSLEDRFTEDNVVIVEAGSGRFFDPGKDYLYPIPSNDIAQSKGAVVQNPNWK